MRPQSADGNGSKAEAETGLKAHQPDGPERPEGQKRPQSPKDAKRPPKGKAGQPGSAPDEPDALTRAGRRFGHERVLTLAAAIGVLALIAALLLLGGGPYERLLALVLGFAAGGLAIACVIHDDRHRLQTALGTAAVETHRLNQRIEELEDAAWELRESDERHASILHALGDVVIRRDMEENVIYANPAAGSLFWPEQSPRPGEKLELPLADTPQDLLSAEATGVFGDILLDTREGPRWFSRIDVTVREGPRGTPVLQTVLRDVTARRKMEEELLAARQNAESASEAKSRFLATVSHEVRTPLNGILGMAALLSDTHLTHEQRAYVRALETSGETLLLLIDELLDFSRAEAGKLTIQPGPVDLESLAEHVVELLAPRAHAKGLEIGFTADPAIPRIVTADANRLRQILFNLAGNGIKFTEEGGVLISLAITPQGGGSLLTLEVRDTGIGFSAADAERLFGEFEQVDHGPARRYGGTGLGLAIVRRLVGLMEGTVEAVAEEGKGAVFRICLPLPEAPDAGGHAGLECLTGRRVVIVSQGVIEGEALALQFTTHGARVQLVQPGDDTLADALPHADLVLLEHGAVADGAGWLATARAAGCVAPAIVLVTPQERDRLDRLREAGFSAYLVRPVRGRTLRRIIASLMGEGGETLAWEAAVDLPPERIPGAPHRLAPARPLRLLLAEDNDINRLLGEALLRKLGHEVTVVPDGLEAWRAASEQNFDAILMDLHMPGLDGLDAMAQIREIETARGRPHVPVLIVTADVMPAARDRARASGVAGFLTKPLSREAVEDALENLPSRT